MRRASPKDARGKGLSVQPNQTRGDEGERKSKEVRSPMKGRCIRKLLVKRKKKKPGSQKKRRIRYKSFPVLETSFSVGGSCIDERLGSHETQISKIEVGVITVLTVGGGT